MLDRQNSRAPVKPLNLYALEHLFRHCVRRMLLRERRIDKVVIRTLLGWRHSGFSLHNAVRIGAADTDGRRAVAEYIPRSPFALEKLRYQARTGTIIYHSTMHPVLKRNVAVFSAGDWLAALTAHIPNAGEHLVRYACAVRATGDGPPLSVGYPRRRRGCRGEGRALAACPLQGRGPSPRTKQRERRRARVFCAAEYGWYSNVHRGKRRKTQGEESTTVAEFNEVSDSAAKRAWARLIKQLYEVGRLVCPRCTGPLGSDYLHLLDDEATLLRNGLPVLPEGHQVRLDGLPNALQRFLDGLPLRVAARDRRRIDPVAPLLSRMNDNRVPAHEPFLPTATPGTVRQSTRPF